MMKLKRVRTEETLPYNHTVILGTITTQSMQRECATTVCSYTGFVDDSGRLTHGLFVADVDIGSDHALVERLRDDAVCMRRHLQ